MRLILNIAIINSNGKNASRWKMPNYLLTITKVVPPAFNSTFQLLMASVRILMTLLDILYILRQYFIQLWWDHIVGSFIVNSRHGNIFPAQFAQLGDVPILMFSWRILPAFQKQSAAY